MVIPERHFSMHDFFLELLSRNFSLVHRLRVGSQTEQQITYRETACPVYARVAANHIRAYLSRTFFDGSDIEEKKLREALARHAQFREKDEVDPSVATAGLKKTLAPRSEVTALDRVEAVWSSLEEYFAWNASIERMFRDSRGKFKSSPAHTITAEMVAGLHRSELKI